MKTAEHIFDKIKKGDYDPTKDGNGVKLGVVPAAPSSAARKPNGCCS